MALFDKSVLENNSLWYRNELVHNILPFWADNGLDKVNGGMFTCLDRSGKLMDSTKSVWFQGRCAYAYSYAYNNIDKNPEWLKVAKSCIDFIEGHCVDPENGQLYFTVTAEGKPLRKLDASRIYAEGLSAGAFCATALGIHKSYLFAAVGANSGGVISGPLSEGVIYATGFSRKSLWGDAAQKRGHVQMPYFSIGGTIDGAVPYPSHMDVRDQFPNRASAPEVLPSEESSIFQAWRLYRFLNGADELEVFDTQLDPLFGQSLENRTSCIIKGYDVESGEVLVNGVPLIKLVTIVDYGHWNFAPGAAIMWNYFKQFSRDPATGELIIK